MENMEEKEIRQEKPKRKRAFKKVSEAETSAEATPTESEEVVNAEKINAETPAEVAAISEKIISESHGADNTATEEQNINSDESNIETIAELPEEVAEISVTESEGAASVSATNDKNVQANDFVKELPVPLINKFNVEMQKQSKSVLNNDGKISIQYKQIKPEYEL